VRVGLDTNVLAYAEGVNGVSMKLAALRLIAQLPTDNTVIPIESLGGAFRPTRTQGSAVAAYGSRCSPQLARRFSLIETSETILFAVANLAADHNFQIWDAVVMSAAAESGCRLLLSGDLQEGFTWSGVTIVNPFASSRHPLLRAPLPDDLG
jgi:predicted nucleic acid-binding protein